MLRPIAVAVLVTVAIAAAAPAFASSAADSTVAPPAAADTAAAPAPASAPAPAAVAPAAAPAAAAAAPAAAPVAAKPPLVYYEKAVVVTDGKAEANGSLQMEFLPLKGELKTFTVNLLAKTKKADIARDIHKELTIAAGEAYKVKLDGEKVKIERADKKTSPTFSLTVSRLAVPGLSLRVEKG
jgi:hypothetical protein